PPRAVSSESASRKRDPVERSVSGHAAPADELFHGPGKLAPAGAATGYSLDRTAGTDAGVIPGLHGRLLGANADLPCGRTAGARAGQGEAGRGCRGSALIGVDVLAQLTRRV